MFLLIFMGAIMKFIHDEKGVRYLSFFFFILSIVTSLSSKKSFLAIVISSLISSILFYFWGLLLLKFENTIFMWLLVLVVGVFLISLI